MEAKLDFVPPPQTQGCHAAPPCFRCLGPVYSRSLGQGLKLTGGLWPLMLHESVSIYRKHGTHHSIAGECSGLFSTHHPGLCLGHQERVDSSIMRMANLFQKIKSGQLNSVPPSLSSFQTQPLSGALFPLVTPLQGRVSDWPFHTDENDAQIVTCSGHTPRKRQPGSKAHTLSTSHSRIIAPQKPRR